jgi:hypothetical protein
MVGEMREQKAKGVSGALRQGIGGVAGETLKRTGSAVRGATSAVSGATGTKAVDGATEQVHEAARTATGAVEGVGEQVQEAARSASGAVERAGGGGAARGEQRTVGEELREIVRGAALEVLVPAARMATTEAAKYAIRRGPQLARDAIARKLADRLRPAIEEAGGPGAFAKGALSSISDARTGLREKLGIGAESQPRPWRERRLPVEESIDVAVPLETAYDRFTEFDQYAEIMSRGETIDERPNERIVWERTDRAEATAVITFHRLSDRLTRVMITYDHQPQGVLEQTTSLFRNPHRGLNADLKRFKAFAETSQEDTETPEAEVEGAAPHPPGRRRSAPRQQKARRRR